MSHARLFAISLLLLLPHPAQAASFTPLGDLPDGLRGGHGTGVSDDGAVVVGTTYYADGREAFRWSGGAMTGLGDLSDGGGSYASGVSADGSVVVGLSYGATDVEAFRWSGGTMTGLGFLPAASNSAALGVSADGAVVVGLSNDQAFRWAEGTMTGLGFLPNDSYSAGYAVSADGEVVVGNSQGTTGYREAFRWSNGVMSSLSEFPDWVMWSGGTAVSADGAFVVGSMGAFVSGSSGITTAEAFRWSEGEMLALGHLPDSGSPRYSAAFGVSADGSVIVGVSSTPNYDGAFVWTESNGMERLSDLLIARGASGLEGWILGEAIAVSPDGRWIAGSGTNPDGRIEAFLADISPVPEPATFWLLGSALAALAMVRR